MNNNAMNGVANPQLPQQQPGPPAQPGQQQPQPGQPGFVGPLPAGPPPQAAAAAANLINPGNPQQWAPLIQALLTNTNALNAAHATQQRQNTYISKRILSTMPRPTGLSSLDLPNQLIGLTHAIVSKHAPTTAVCHTPSMLFLADGTTGKPAYNT